MQLPKLSSTVTWALISGAAASGLTILIGRLLKKETKKPAIECVLFSPRDSHYLQSAFSCRRPSCSACNFKRLCALLRTSKCKLDICMYLITEPQLTDIIIALCKKGVRIRILTDRQMSDDSNKCKIGHFLKHHIPVKYIEAQGMMHNKFFIIDGKIVVTGSCNWTQNALAHNYENLVIIRDEKIAQQYTRYYCDLWFTH